MRTISTHSPRTVGVSLAGFCLVVSLASGLYANADKTPAKPKVMPKKQSDVTFNRDIAPLVFDRCTTCHRPGEGAPFTLMNYRDVMKRGKLISEVTKSRLMPPWKPGPSDCELSDDTHLTDDQIQLFQRWVAMGMKEGAAADLPAQPKYTPGWTLGKPDLVVEMPVPFPVPADGPDIYRNFVLPLNLPADTYIRAIDFRPSARSVVHHSLFFYDSSGGTKARDGEDGKPGFGGAMGGFLGGARSLGPGSAALTSVGGLGGWAVGAQPVPMPAGLAYFVPKGSDMILSTHFHPSGKAESEKSIVGIYFAKTPPTKQFTSVQLPPVFGALSGLKIPAGAKEYTIEDSFTLPVDAQIFGVAAHAHYLGKSMTLTATLPDGTKKTVFSIPDWDFNWQGQYLFKEFVTLPKGTVLHGIVTYDNSVDNPHQPSNPPKEVTWGEQSNDEMGSIILRMVATNEADLKTLKKEYRAHLVEQYIKHPFKPRQEGK